MENVLESLAKLKRENLRRSKQQEVERLRNWIGEWEAEIKRLEDVRSRLLGDRE
ncbi:hypothetical protein H6S82_01120 [Planktothrix sp. FACHB-1355]|nr:hypothetical protein [Planktothrix sp. FACHB-1355]